MKFTLEIDCDNAAFGQEAGQRQSEIVRILEECVDCIICKGLRPDKRYPLTDINGNRVGHYSLSTGD